MVNAKTKRIAEMVDMLPDEEQNLAYELIKRIILAWDSDFTKLTASERKELEEAQSGEYVNAKDINWDE